jgi:hypothetical protein
VLPQQIGKLAAKHNETKAAAATAGATAEQKLVKTGCFG